MKKLSMICMAALLLLAASCKKDKQTEQYDGESFSATAETQQGDSKTHIDNNDDNQKVVKWDAGDVILACSNSYPNGYTFVAQEDNVTKATFIPQGNKPVGFFAEGYTYTAIYPHGKAEISGGAYYLTLPDSQDAVYEDGAFQCAFANGANPMAATSTERDLVFKNICGMLDLSLYSETECYVNTITITTNGEENLHGKGEVTFDGGVPQLGSLTNGGKTLTLNCNDKLMSQDESTPSHFCFVLPAGTLASGFSVTVTDKDGLTWTKSTTVNNAIERRKIRQMQNLSVACASDVPEGFVDLGTHVDGIGGTRPLYWAKCNVGAENSWNIGNYFQWGYTAKDNHCGYFDGESYLFGTEKGGGDIWLHRYCVNSYQWEYVSGVSFAESMDNESELRNQDDAAYVDNNENRMPTYDEMYELYAVAYFEWTENYNGKGVAGSIIWKAKDVNDMGKRNVYETSHNANYSFDDPHIFVPVSGRHTMGDKYDYLGEASNRPARAYFWTRTLWVGESVPGDGGCQYASCFREQEDLHDSTGGTGRCVGLPVRPVREGNN